MSKKFFVEIVRYFYEVGTVTVEAETHEEAGDKALTLPDDAFRWEGVEREYIPNDLLMTSEMREEN